VLVPLQTGRSAEAGKIHQFDDWPVLHMGEHSTSSAPRSTCPDFDVDAQRCRIPAFVDLGRKIRKNLPGIEAAMLHGLSNALIESTNTKLRVLHRMAFGFKEPEHLIALALLDRGGYCPPLPGRGAA
jgi:hypothetical protein